MPDRKRHWGAEAKGLPRIPCGAKTRAGHPCKRMSVPGHWRCVHHGGLSTGAKTPEGKTRQAEGSKQYRSRMHALKAAGLIDRLPWVATIQAGRARWVDRLKAAGLKVPNGRNPKDAPKTRKDPVIAKAQKIVERLERTMAIKKRGGLLAPVVTDDGKVPDVPVRPWGELNKTEKLETAADMALDVTRKILATPVDLENLPLLKIQKDAALQIIGAAVRISETQASAMAQEQKRETILEQMAAAFDAAQKARNES